ncbi:MAG: hypothetical protein IIB72_00695, partial [Proteobacteria bacterium]|nr:hypothetical protein [Pseudomonadota bacterium]
ALGDGSRFGVRISYCRESTRLDTAGGIIKSLPQLQDDCFIVVNADIWTDFDFSNLQAVDGKDRLAHLILADNTDHNPYGDFYIDDAGRVHEDHSARDQKLTFSGISVLHKNLFTGLAIEPRSVVPLLQAAMTENQVSGEIHLGLWMDVGTPQRLQEVNVLANAAAGE